MEPLQLRKRRSCYHLDRHGTDQECDEDDDDYCYSDDEDCCDPCDPSCPPSTQGLGATPACGGSPGGGDPGPQRPIDTVTDSLARGALTSRLSNFGTSNCNKVFNNVIVTYTTGGFVGTANSTKFYNTTNPVFPIDTQDQVSANGSSTTLGTSLSTGGTALTIGASGAWPSVLLGANFLSNTNSTYQQNVLLHELLHVYTYRWSDSEVLSAFSAYGLSNPNRDSEDISAWLSTDCTSTPSGVQWWN